MAYYLTPADRRARMELLRQQRDPVYRRQKEREEEARLEAAQAASVSAAEQKEESNGFVTALHTAGDVGANLLTGVGKGLEGIYDLGAGIVGAVGGLFSDEFENDVKAHIAKDHVGEWYGDAWQAALDQSALNNSKVGEIIEGVAQGVGQMLPAVAVSFIPGIGTAAAAKLALGTTIASAAGTGTEEAFRDGASYGKGMLYGAASGAVGGITEKLTGGAAKAVFGKGFLDNVVGKVAKTGAARVAADAVGEGVEEMISEAANPALKSIYKGKDALKEYGEADFWAGVGEAGIIGAGTSVAYGGTVGKVTRTSGVYADANNVLEHIDEQESRIAKGDLSAAQEQKARESIKKDYQLLEKRLESAKPKVRERVLQNPTLAAAFDTSGRMKAEFAEQVDNQIRAAGDTSSGLDRRYYSPSARGREAELIEGLAAQGTKVYEGELSTEENKAYQKAKKIHTKLKEMGFVNTDLVLSETMPDVNAYLDGNTVVIGKDSLADGSYVKHLVHETTHFTEGTRGWRDVVEHVFGKDGSAVQPIIERVKNSGYGVTQADVDTVLKVMREGTLKEHRFTKEQLTLVNEVVAMQMEETFGSEDAVNRLVQEKPNLAVRVWERIKAFLQTFGKSDAEKAEIQNLRRTEELFRNALHGAGIGYAMNELTRASMESVQNDAENDAETVDENGEVRYNNGEVQRSVKIAKYISYAKLGQGNVAAIKRALSKLYEGVGDSVANGIAIEYGDTVFIVDSGKENGEIRFGARGKLKISASTLRAEYVRRTNVEAVSNGHISDGLSSRFGDKYGDNRAGNLRREPGAELPTDKGKSANNQRGVSDNDANRGRSVKQSRKATDDTTKIPKWAKESYSFAEITGEKLTAEELTELQELREQKKHMDEVVKSSQGKANDKVYTKKDAESVLSSVLREELTFAQGDAMGSLYGPKKTEAIDRIRRALNTAKEGRRAGVALEIASYILDNAVIDVIDPFVSENAEIDYRALRTYARRLDLSTLSAEDAKKYGKGWAASKELVERGEAISLKDAATELNGAGFAIDESGGAETLKGIQAEYELARSIIKNEYKTKITRLNLDEYDALRENIAKEILRGFDKTGSRSRDALERKHIEDEREQWRARLKNQLVRTRETISAQAEKHKAVAEHWRRERAIVAEHHKLLGQLQRTAQTFANLNTGRYVNAANYKNSSFTEAIRELSRINWRGVPVRPQKIREHFAKLAAWYTKDNPLYRGGDDGNGNALFRKDIKEALDALGNKENGTLTTAELSSANNILQYFANEVKNHNTIYKNEKRIDAVPEAKRYIETMARAKEIAVKCGIWQRLTRSGFARLVADPAMLMRQADGYLKGFFTEQFEELRQGTVDAAVKEHELAEEFAKFFEKNTQYGKRYNNAIVTFGGKEMPLQEAIQLFMTMKREHAYAGIACAGFEIDGKDGKDNISDGFGELLEKHVDAEYKKLPDEEFLTLTAEARERAERAALENAVAEQRAELEKQFTAEDKALIAVMERGYEAAREIKVKIDNILQGYSNVVDGYYCPIRRAGLVENIDSFSGFEGDRVSNLPMNRDTVKNAHKLYIEPAHVVYMRHMKAISLYHGLGVFTDNFNRLFNLNVAENASAPSTIRDALGRSNNYTKEMLTYFKELKQDVEGISKKRNTEKFYNDAVAFIRSAYATYQLGANPKVWVTQLSSLIAATNILDADCIAKAVKVSGKDVDEYCPLAWVRNNDSAAAMAQAVETPQNVVQRAGRGILRKIRDVAMWPIGKVDRLVIRHLFAACQVQVEKDGGAKVGTKENKIAAGKLMTRVILETQQNSLATERSAAMRSGDELAKGFTMFSADAMKVGARFVDAFGELSALKTLRKEAKRAGNAAEVERLNKEIKRAVKQCRRSATALLGVAVFNALIAYGFKLLYRRDEDESIGTFIADTFGNVLGGIPFVRDFYSFFQDGFEMDHFLISTVNDVLGTAAASFELVKDAASGKEVTRQEAMGNMRKVFYAIGQISGVPVRNVYNVTTGFLNRVSPETGYAVDSLFVAKPYTSDLKKAMEAGDDEMVSTIAGLMLGEDSGALDAETQNAMRELVAKGYSVLPRSVGDSITLDGVEIPLSGKQQSRFRKLYRIGDDAVADMVKLKQFDSADAEVQANAIKFVYDVYWDLATESVAGVDLAEKNVLFAEAIPIEKLAIIIATARAFESDRDRNGKAIAGTKKRKVQTFVNSLHLTAAQKYMVMGYLGYSNVNGEAQVKRYINGLNLSEYEKTALREYCGYELSEKERESMYSWTQKAKYLPYGGQDPNDPERVAAK